MHQGCKPFVFLHVAPSCLKHKTEEREAKLWLKGVTVMPNFFDRVLFKFPFIFQGKPVWHQGFNKFYRNRVLVCS